MADTDQALLPDDPRVGQWVANLADAPRRSAALDSLARFVTHRMTAVAAPISQAEGDTCLIVLGQPTAVVEQQVRSRIAANAGAATLTAFLRGVAADINKLLVTCLPDQAAKEVRERPTREATATAETRPHGRPAGTPADEKRDKPLNRFDAWARLHRRVCEFDEPVRAVFDLTFYAGATVELSARLLGMSVDEIEFRKVQGILLLGELADDAFRAS